VDSFDRLPAVSPFSYVPATSQATSQATYWLRSRLRSSQGGRLRGFDGGFGGPGFGAGNPGRARGYGQSPSAMLTRWARFPGAGLSLRCSVSGPRCRVPGTEEGNRAIRRNARLMLRKRAHGVCYAKHSMALRCHRLSLKSLGRRGRSRGPVRTEPSRSIPLRWEGAVRMVETPLGYTQSTCSPRTWPRAVHVRGSTWTPWRSTSNGVAGGRVERGWRPPMPPEWGDPRVCRAWPGFGTTFSNLLSNVSPLRRGRRGGGVQRG
jgi:hypothetical protein